MLNPTTLIVNTMPARWLAGGKVATAAGVVGGAKGAFSAGMATLGPLGGLALLLAGSVLLAWKADDRSHEIRDALHHSHDPDAEGDTMAMEAAGLEPPVTSSEEI
ncbi:MAG: hypothetical protein HQL53_14225 [Magnetococcales bacterium]|nr:hypothetical protein [Magnetococcales bacterium]